MSIGSIDSEAALATFIENQLEASRLAVLARQLQNPAAPAAPAAHAATHQDGGADPVTVREAMMAAGALGPSKGVFSAYRAAALTRTSAQTILYDTEERDVSSWYDPVTGRFTPQVAGYYSLKAAIGCTPGLDQYAQLGVRKNGADHKYGAMVWGRGSGAAYAVVAPDVQANGTTDFFDVIFYTSAAVAVTVSVGLANCYFQGHLIGRS